MPSDLLIDFVWGLVFLVLLNTILILAVWKYVANMKNILRNIQTGDTASKEVFIDIIKALDRIHSLVYWKYKNEENKNEKV